MGGIEQSDTLTTEGAARYLGVSERTIQRWARSYRIPGRKIGRYWFFSKRLLDLRIEEGMLDRDPHHAIERRKK